MDDDDESYQATEGGHQSDGTERFVQLIAEHQNQLFGYVYSLLADRGVASDVVQETNLVLWRKRSEFDLARPFLPWAFTIARYQVLARIRDQQRDRVLLDTSLAESIAEFTEELSRRENQDELRDHLRVCMRELTDKNRQLIEWHYFREMPIADMAASLGRGVSAIKVALLRSRRHLERCIRHAQEAS